MLRQVGLLLVLCTLVLTASVNDEKDVTNKEVNEKQPVLIYSDDDKVPLPLEGHVPNSEQLGEFQPVELPTAFTLYDLDKNGFVNLDELAEATETKEEDAQNPFYNADLNGDGQLDEGEFQQAPWAFKPEVEEEKS
ncbi:uncharacterized protein LOC144439929 [Glandiceps talaboti]